MWIWIRKEDWGVWCFDDKKPGFTNITSLSLSGYLHIYLYMVIIILMSKQKCGSGLEKEDRGVWFLADKKRGFTKITWEKLLRKFFEVSFVVLIKKTWIYNDDMSKKLLREKKILSGIAIFVFFLIELWNQLCNTSLYHLT